MWTQDEVGKLQALQIDASRNPREKMIPLVVHFKAGGTVYSITEKRVPLGASKGLAQKVRDAVQEGQLDWLLSPAPEPASQPPSTGAGPDEDSESVIRLWLRDHFEDAVLAAIAYARHLGDRVQGTRTSKHGFVLVNTSGPDYGPYEQEIIRSIREADHEFARLASAFERKLSTGNLDRAGELVTEIRSLLDGWVRL